MTIAEPPELESVASAPATASPYGEEVYELPPAASRRRWWAWLLIPVVVVAVLAALWYAGWHPAKARTEALRAQTSALNSAPIRARVGRPRPGPAVQNVTLPGAVEPIEEAIVHARVAGIVAHRLVELGAVVTAGQALVELDAPELVQQAALAEAQVGERRAGAAQAEATLDFEALAFKRAQTLGPELVGAQALEERRARHAVAAADLAAARARIAAAEAESARLRLLVGFTSVTSPIAGTVVARSVELGDAVAGGASGTSLLRVARLDRIRVVVSVPQAQAGGLSVGLAATITPRGGPAIPATITRLAGALDAATRAMRVECELPAHPRLLSGGYTQVTFAFPVAKPGLQVPSDAIIPGPKGPRVATLDAEGRVKLVGITIDTDDGADLTVSAGLAATDQVLLNPSSAIEEGRLVEITPDPPPKTADKPGEKPAGANDKPIPSGDKPAPSAGKPATPPGG